MRKQVVPIFVVLSWQMGAFVILNRVSTSWKSVLFIWTMRQGLASLLQQFLLDAKVLERKKGAVTYLQRAEDIMDFLIVIGAMQARDDFERVKILRETRNDLNRANNAETANIARTVSASMKTINSISKIKDIMGLENLPVDLQEVAQLRIQHPDYSIQQLADSLSTPLTKSGVNHRLRKINKIADEL